MCSATKNQKSNNKGKKVAIESQLRFACHIKKAIDIKNTAPMAHSQRNTICSRGVSLFTFKIVDYSFTSALMLSPYFSNRRYSAALEMPSVSAAANTFP